MVTCTIFISINYYLMSVAAAHKMGIFNRGTQLWDDDSSISNDKNYTGGLWNGAGHNRIVAGYISLQAT